MTSVTETIESAELRELLAEILTEALQDADTVLRDPRGLDVLLDAVLCTVGASLTRAMAQPEEAK